MKTEECPAQAEKKPPAVAGKLRNDSRKILADAMPDTGNVRAKQGAAFMGIGLSTFWLYVNKGRIKKPIKLGSRVSVWDAEYIRHLAKNGIPEKGEA